MTKKYSAAFKERAVKLAVESDQPMAPTARDLGVNKNTLPTWMGQYHRAERQEKEGNDEHVYEELKRLRKENARLCRRIARSSNRPQRPARNSCREVRVDARAA